MEALRPLPWNRPRMNIIDASLLPLRLSVFVFFALSIFYLIRHRIVQDRRLLISVLVGAGFLIHAVAWTSLNLLAADGDKGAIVRSLVFSPALLFLAGAMWVVSYTGMVLREQDGGYWRRNHATGKWLEAVMTCIAASLLLTLVGMLASKALKISITPFSPDTTILVLIWALRILAYSIGEEVFFRGWVQGFLGLKLARFRGGRVIAVLLTSLVFAVQHTGGNAVLALGLAFAGGVVFGTVFERHGLVAAIATHLLANVQAALLLPLLSR